MNTREPKTVKYEFSEEKPTIVEEPLIKYPTLDLDMSKRYTYADYLTWIDDVRRELIGGFVYLMSAPTELHARLTHLASWFMEAFVRKKKGNCRIYHAPFDVRFPKEGYTEDNQIYDVVQPDICVICDLSKLDERGCIGAPDLIVEVLSPSTAKVDWNHKFNLYESAGVKEYWIVDTNAKNIHVFLLQPNGKYDNGTVYEYPEQVPVHIFEGLEIDLKELFDMNTQEEPKTVKYEFSEEKPIIVEEPLIKYAPLNLDMSKRYTYADYLTWIDDVRRELIGGFVYLMSAPTTLHARFTYLVGWFMGAFVRNKKGKCQIFHAPFDVRFPKEGFTEDNQIYDVVQPDICVICDLSKLDERGCIGAPDLIVEVLSPSTAKVDWNHKFNLYESAGVKEYWIVDTNAKNIHVFLLQPNGKYDNGTVYEYPEQVPVHIFEGLEIDLKELFEE